MKKRVVALLLALMFSVTGMIATDSKAYAEDLTEDVSEDVDISVIWTEDALVGYGVSQTYGVYLLRGTSIINDAGGGKIGWGGITEAAKRCKVTCNAIVERKVDGNWTRVTSATVTNANAYAATVGKTLSVGSGYYYRVRCIHYASSDGGSSCTGALWM